MTYHHHYIVCGIRFFVCDYKKIISIITNNYKEKIVVAPLASHPVMEAYYDHNLASLYNNMQYVLPDGYIVWAIRFLYEISLRQRIYGPELLLQVSKMCEKSKKSIFLCGNNCEVITYKLRQLFPNLIIAGSFEMKGKKYNESFVGEINKAILQTKASCVCIGIGSPNQHILATNLHIKLPVICVGAGFDLIAGIEKQAPVWMRENGLEWLYRFTQNPKKLWKRYLIFGPLFVLLVLKDRLSRLLFEVRHACI